MLSHGAIQAYIFFGDGVGFGQQCRSCGGRHCVAQAIELGTHAVERPIQVDRRGPACSKRSHSLNKASEKRIARLLLQAQGLQCHTVDRGATDGRRATHHHGFDARRYRKR